MIIVLLSTLCVYNSLNLNSLPACTICGKLGVETSHNSCFSAYVDTVRMLANTDLDNNYVSCVHAKCLQHDSCIAY